jgi:hypothetical protein
VTRHGRVWSRQKRQRGHLAEAVLGPLGAGGLGPGLANIAHLLEGAEEIGVEGFFGEVPIEPLDEGVLIRLPRLDLADGNAPGRTPVHEGLRGELGPIVDA